MYHYLNQGLIVPVKFTLLFAKRLVSLARNANSWWMVPVMLLKEMSNELSQGVQVQLMGMAPVRLLFATDT